MGRGSKMGVYQWLGARAKTGSIWRETVEGSEPEKLTENCGFAFDASPDGKYLLTLIAAGDKLGIYAFSLADSSCTMLVPGIVTFGINVDKDGKSFLYALPGKKDVTIYRQKLADGKAARPAASRVETPLRVSASHRRERLRLFARPHHRRLRPPQRPRRPLPAHAITRTESTSHLVISTEAVRRFFLSFAPGRSRAAQWRNSLRSTTGAALRARVGILERPSSTPLRNIFHLR